MPTASYRIQIDWQNNGSFTGTGDKVTARTLRVEFARGRDVDSQLTGRSAAGSAQILLNNQSGDYNSLKASGPLYGSLLPGRRVQIDWGTGTFGNFPINLMTPAWAGYIERIIPKPSVKGLDTAIIECIGALGFVNQKEISLETLKNVDTGAVIGSILDRAGWPTGTVFRDIDTGKTTIGRVWFNHKRTLDAMRKIEETEAGFLRESGSGGIIFENRHRRLTGTYQTSQATFTDSQTGTLVYNAVEQEDPLPFVFTEFLATIQPYTTGATATLWAWSGTGTLSRTIPPSSTAIVSAVYPNPTATANALGVDSWITPTATVDFNIWTDTAGTGTNINADFSLTATSFGNELRLLFSNTGTRIGYLTTGQARGIPVFAAEKMGVAATSTGTAFGTRTFPSPAEWIPNVDEAQDWARWNAALYGTPAVRFSMEYIANRSTAHINQAVLRDVSDRITIIGTGTANLGIAREVYIEGMKHIIDNDRTHTVTYYLSDGTQLSDAWVIDISDLDIRTRLVF